MIALIGLKRYLAELNVNYKGSAKRLLEGGAFKSTREDAPASNLKSVPEGASLGPDVRQLRAIALVT